MALDNFKKTSMRIDKANQRFLDYQNAKVGDVNGRELLVQITNNGVVEDQTGTTLKLNWQHENGKQGYANFKAVDIKSGKYSLYYPKEMLYKGTVDASVEINSNGQITNTMNFKIIVHGDVFNGEAGTVNGVFISLADVNKKLDDREAEYVELKSRQTSVETQFNAIQQEITDKDVISAPEIIAARNGEPTLRDRLDKEHQNVTTQLAKSNTIQAESVINKPASKQLSIIKKREPLVLFTDDDGSSQIVPKLKPVSEETGVPFSIALIEKRLRDGSGITLKEAKDLQDELGWEVLSHGYNDTALGNEDLSEDELERQIRDSMKYLREKGFNVQNFVYPGGQSSKNAIRVVSKYANAVLGTGVAPNNYPLQMYNINRLAYPQTAPNNTFAFYKSKVDEAVANNRILVWMLHCGQPSLDDIQLSILVDLINYIKSIGVKMPTVQGAVDFVGNVIDINDREFYMSADGTNNIVNTMFKNISLSDASDLVSIEDAPDSFERNKVTVSIVNTTRNLSPSSLGGTLITNALNNVAYTSQTFIDLQGNQYVRYALNASEWRGFKKTITSKQTLTHDFPTRTVKANTSFWKVIYDSSIRTSEVIVAQPVGTLEMGLSFNCWAHGNGQAVIEIHNGTNADINMSARRFNVQRLEV